MTFAKLLWTLAVSRLSDTSSAYCRHLLLSCAGAPQNDMRVSALCSPFSFRKPMSELAHPEPRTRPQPDSAPREATGSHNFIMKSPPPSSSHSVNLNPACRSCKHISRVSFSWRPATSKHRSYQQVLFCSLQLRRR